MWKLLIGLLQSAPLVIQLQERKKFLRDTNLHLILINSSGSVIYNHLVVCTDVKFIHESKEIIKEGIEEVRENILDIPTSQ